ncbi:MAG: MFS transporter [Bernardetiaceae bacterium]|nr:MFS transporter [Bernardetiaceae bacterium]
MLLPSALRHARWAVAAMFFISGCTFASWAVRIPAIQLGLGLSEGQLGTVLLGMPIGSLVSLPLAGWLTTRLGSRPITLASAVAFPLVLLLLGLAPNAWWLAGALFLAGMAGDILNIAMNTQAVAVEKGYGRPIMVSFHGLFSLGNLAGASFGGLMAEAGWAPLAHFGLVAASCLALLAGAGWFLVAEPPAPRHEPLLARPDAALWWLGLVAFCCMLGEGAMADWSSVYLAKATQSVAGVSTLAYAAFTLAMTVGRFSGDALAQRFGVTRVIQGGGLVAAAGLALALLCPGLGPIVAGIALVGAGLSTIVPLVYSAAGHSKTLAPGVALAAVSTVGYVGFLFGPPLIGWGAEAWSLRMALWLVVGLSLLMVPLATKVR